MMNYLTRALHKFTRRDQEFAAVMEQATVEREILDKRLDMLMQATLDHEGDWFLQLIKKDPGCAFKVLDSCGGNSGA